MNGSIYAHTPPVNYNAQKGVPKKQIDNLSTIPSSLQLYITSFLPEKDVNNFKSVNPILTDSLKTEIDNIILNLCNNTHHDYKPDYLANVIANFFKHEENNNRNLIVGNKNLRDVLICLVNDQNQTQMGREYLAETFLKLTQTFSGKAYFINNEQHAFLIQDPTSRDRYINLNSDSIELRGAFIKLVNHSENTIDCRKLLTKIFENLIDDESVQDLFLEDESFKNAMVTFASNPENRPFCTNLLEKILKKNIEDGLIPKIDAYNINHLNQVKENQENLLNIVFRLHPPEKIRDTILSLCRQPHLAHAPTYLLQAFTHLIGTPSGKTFFLSNAHTELRDAFIYLAKQTNHNLIDREFLAQAFASIIEDPNGRSVFLNNELLKKAFISLANNTDHNSIGLNFLADAFNSIIEDPNGRAFFLNSELFQKTFTSLANHTDHNPIGRKFIVKMFAHLIKTPDGRAFFRNSESFQKTFTSLANHSDHSSDGLNYLAQTFVHLTKDSDGITFFRNSELFQKTFTSLANHSDLSSDGRQYLAQAFVHLIKHDNISFFFMNNELLKKDFIKLVNCDDHTLQGISNIALVFEYIACHSLGRHNLRTSTPLSDAFIKFANQKNLTKAGRAYMAAAIIWIIDKKEDVNKMFSNEYGLSNTLIRLINHPDNTDEIKKYIQDAELEASNYHNEPACIVS